MPDPKLLKVDDRIRFISRPEEWSADDYLVCAEDVAFIDALIVRGRPSRIAKIDEHGTPWINAKFLTTNGWEHHTWAISEKTGWRLVRRNGSQ